MLLRFGTSDERLSIYSTYMSSYFFQTEISKIFALQRYIFKEVLLNAVYFKHGMKKKSALSNLLYSIFPMRGRKTIKFTIGESEA